MMAVEATVIAMYESLIAFVPHFYPMVPLTVRCTHRIDLLSSGTHDRFEHYAPVSVASLLCFATDKLQLDVRLLTDPELIAGTSTDSTLCRRIHLRRCDPVKTL